MTGDALPNGMALGGVGAGGMMIGPDGRVRNITTNNNRLDGERIAVSPGAFLAIRAAQGDRLETRILQRSTDAAFQKAGVEPPLLSAEQSAWQGLYPQSSFELTAPEFPLGLTWSYLSPVVPYDAEAATLPLIFIRMTLANPTDAPWRISGLANWENLSGCAAGRAPKDRGEAEAVHRGAETGEPEPGEGEEPRLIGLRFGHSGEPRNNQEGACALLAAPDTEAAVTVAAWDVTSALDTAAFWERFMAYGRLWRAISAYPSRHGMAVCQSVEVPPGQKRTLVWGLAWRFPRFVMDGKDYGNWYAVNFASPAAIAWHGVKHYGYYIQAVEEWQRRVTDSSLPGWLSRALINCNAPLSTNTLVDRESNFAMIDSPADPAISSMANRFPSSLGPILFLPEFSIMELRGLQQAIEARHDALPADLGLMTARAPRMAAADAESLRLACEWALTVYRDYRMTGKRTRFELLFPLAQRLMQRASREDGDSDGIPDGADAVTRGLWVAALRAYGRMAADSRRRDEAKRATQLLGLALETYETALDQPLESGEEWLSPWITEFLCLGALPWRRPPLEDAEEDLGYLAALARASVAIYRGDAAGGLALARKAAGALTDGCPSNPARLRRELPALWHILYALEGFWYDVPGQVMWLRPNLPKGVTSLRAPLFTTLCWGELRFSLSKKGPYAQSIGLTFDSPLSVKSVIARVPKEIDRFCVACRSEEGLERTRHAAGGHGAERLIEIVFDRPLRVGDVFNLTIREAS